MNLLKTLSQVLFPPTCPLCRTLVSEEATLCRTCWPTVDFIEAPNCKCCGRPLPMGEFEDKPTCNACMKTPPDFQQNVSVLVYAHRSKSLVLSFKHGEQFHMGPFLAQLMARKGVALLSDTDVLLPIPLHWTRLVKRGFNQAGELAKHISKITSVPYDVSTLLRTKATPPQDGLTKTQRQDNLNQAFTLPHPERIYQKRILLIDDVITTGATLNSAARILKKGGAASVNTLTLAWVPPTHKKTL